MDYSNIDSNVENFSEVNGYIIELKQVVGNGTTANVYKALNKKTGKKVAVKWYKEKMRHLSHVELKNLSQIDHASILQIYQGVQLEDCELLIFMELCNRGSLYESIEMHCGLPDDWMLALLTCLSASLEHLRDKKLSHRDIQPGNILVHVSEQTNQLIIKLGDLDSSIRLDDTESRSITICGTQEFMHPDLHSKLRAQACADHDLWSIAITLYHAITNSMPVKPHDSLDCQATSDMIQRMYRERPANKIRGVQTSVDPEKFDWRSDFPVQNRISTMLAREFREMILGMLSLEEGRAWPCATFFSESKRILGGYRRVPFFFALDGMFETMLIETPITYEKLRAAVRSRWGEEIARGGQPDTSSSDQFILTTLDHVIESAESQAMLVRALPANEFYADMNYSRLANRSASGAGGTMLLVLCENRVEGPPPPTTSSSAAAATPLSSKSKSSENEGCRRFRVPQITRDVQLSVCNEQAFRKLKANGVIADISNLLSFIYTCKVCYDWHMAQISCWQSAGHVFSRHVICVRAQQVMQRMRAEVELCDQLVDLAMTAGGGEGRGAGTAGDASADSQLDTQIKEMKKQVAHLERHAKDLYEKFVVKKEHIAKLTYEINKCFQAIPFDLEAMNEHVLNANRLYDELRNILESNIQNTRLFNQELSPRLFALQSMATKATKLQRNLSESAKKLHKTMDKTLNREGFAQLAKLSAFSNMFDKLAEQRRELQNAVKKRYSGAATVASSSNTSTSITQTESQNAELERGVDALDIGRGGFAFANPDENLNSVDDDDDQYFSLMPQK